MGDAAEHWNICRADNLLYVFLHGGNGEDTGYGGQSEEIRGVHTGNQTGTADGGLYRPSVDAASNGGQFIFSVYSGVTELDRRRDAYTGRVLWRDGVIDSGIGGIAYDEADRSDGSDEAL